MSDGEDFVDADWNGKQHLTHCEHLNNNNAKCYLRSLFPTIGDQATVRPSLSKLLGGHTISRRSAAGHWLR